MKIHPKAAWTPPSMTARLLVHERFDGTVWEPACGAGYMADVFRTLDHEVVSTDLLDYGYAGQVRRMDFLADAPDFSFENIVTNPPYDHSVPAWVERCCWYRPRKIALLLPVPALKDCLRGVSDMLLSRMILFDRRHSRFIDPVEGDRPAAWPVAWFVLTRGHRGPFIGHTGGLK